MHFFLGALSVNSILSAVTEIATRNNHQFLIGSMPGSKGDGGGDWGSGPHPSGLEDHKAIGLGILVWTSIPKPTAPQGHPLPFR